MCPPKNATFPAALIAAMLLCVTEPHSHATLLVYDNFNNNSTGNLTGQTTTGFGLTGTYSMNGNQSNQSFTVTSGGLPFSTLSSSLGNSVVATSLAGGGADSNVGLSLGTAMTGTLYSSYLINITVQNTSPAALAETRIATNSTDNGGASRFRLMADSLTSNVATPTVGYDGTPISGSTNLSINTTYLMVGRFTNVGISLSAGTPGQATLFAMTAAQYNSFIAGGGNDAYLDGATVGTGNNQITATATDAAVTSGTFSFAPGNFYQTGIIGSVGTETFTYDEVRFGTTLQDVTTPTPEPTSALLAVCGVTLLLTRRQRGHATRER